MIRALPEDGVIRETGAYRCTLEHYHTQDICPGPSVSSTHIRTVTTTSAWAFYAMFTERYEREANPAFDFGAAVHALALGDEVFSERYAVLPFDSRRTKEAKEWEQNERDAGKRVITQSDLENIGKLMENLSAHPLVQAGIFQGQPEVSLVWQDEITGLWIKARPDVLQLNGQVVADLKTCASASLLDCQRSITKFGYDQQMALCIEGIERVYGVSATDVLLIFAEKTAPYHVRAMPIDEDTLYWAKVRNRQGIDRIADILENGANPIFDDDETPYTLPPSLSEKYAEMQQDGLLPSME